MYDNLLFTEGYAKARQDEVANRIRRDQVVAMIQPAPTGFSPRRIIASALVRLAIIVDANAGRRAAAITQ